MRFIGLEEINPYKDIYDYKIFRYDDKIELGNSNSFICNLSVITLSTEEVFIQKGFPKSKVVAIISDFSDQIDLKELNEGIINFIQEELPLLDINEENIDIKVIKS